MVQSIICTHDHSIQSKSKDIQHNDPNFENTKKGYSEAVIRRTYNIMAKRKRTNEKKPRK
jgi:hypothetical protein